MKQFPSQVTNSFYPPFFKTQISKFLNSFIQFFFSLIQDFWIYFVQWDLFWDLFLDLFWIYFGSIRPNRTEMNRDKAIKYIISKNKPYLFGYVLMFLMFNVEDFSESFETRLPNVHKTLTVVDILQCFSF